MKKILFASSALVAVAAAGTAQASEPIQLEVGGYMEQWAGVADQDVGESKNAFQSDAEVHFSGKTTLDNGIEVGAKIELEGEETAQLVRYAAPFDLSGLLRFFVKAEDPKLRVDIGVDVPRLDPGRPYFLSPVIYK